MNIALQHKRLPTSTSAIDIRLATPDDVPLIMPLLEQFRIESAWSELVTIDYPRAEAFLRRCIGMTHTYILAFDGDKCIGMISWHLDANMSNPIAVIDETFMLAPYRKTNLGRKLVALALYVARCDGVKFFNFPLASGMKQTKTYVNMLRKFGARPVGVIMCVIL